MDAAGEWNPWNEHGDVGRAIRGGDDGVGGEVVGRDGQVQGGRGVAILGDRILEGLES